MGQVGLGWNPTSTAMASNSPSRPGGAAAGPVSVACW